jgi:hypothetical protein
VSPFDSAKTSALAVLFRQSRDHRDDAWIQQFYSAVPDANLRSFHPQVHKGPDHFPYFHMALPDPGPSTPASLTQVLDQALNDGFGIAIFADSNRSKDPEWVFTYGDLLSYSLYGRFDGEGTDGAAGGSSAPGDQPRILKAAPSESYLPTRARRVLGRFLHDVFQHPAPKVALIVDPRLNPSRNPMINLTLAQYHGDARKRDAAMRYLTWFVPRSYSLMSKPDDWDDTGFVPLS